MLYIIVVTLSSEHVCALCTIVVLKLLVPQTSNLASQQSQVLKQTNACAALMISDRSQRRSIWDCSHLNTRKPWFCILTLTQTLSMSAICTTLWSMEWQTGMAVIMS
jgi:hypothetical protein